MAGLSYPATFSPPLPRADWASENPYLPQFEFGQESDGSKGIKVGPGYWNDLPYLANSGIKVYRALLAQTGTNAPVATVLENTLGGPLVWTRNAVGDYIGTLASVFPENKVVPFAPQNFEEGADGDYLFPVLNRLNDNQIGLQTRLFSTQATKEMEIAALLITVHVFP